MINSNIKNCVNNNIENYNVTDSDFINCIYKNANNEKVVTVIKDAKSKKVNDELTKITNNLLTTEINNTNNLFDAIYTIYGKIDNDNLEPYIDGQAKNTNVFDTKMYFVFKGGNTIKYWVNKTYLEKLGDKTRNLEEILSSKISISENESINSCSDFDFSLYIDFNDETEYNKIIKDIGARILLLRNNINYIINDESLKYFNNNIIEYTSDKYFENTNIDLLQKLYEYIDLKLKDIPNIIIQPTNVQFEFITKCDDFILTRDNVNDENMMYTREVDEKLIISFNNLIQFNTTDFDLFRIKLGILANYENINEKFSNIFKSEIFDLTVLRKNDSNLKKMCSNITEYTNIIHLKFDNKIIPVRIYNIKYILIDLLEMLFIQSICPWLNAKYEKRLIRFSFITSLYNQENHDNNKSLITNNELAFGIFNILNILSVIHSFNLLTSASTNEELFYNNYLFKYVINKNLIIIKNNNLFTDNIIKQIINDDYSYDNLNNFKEYISYPNKYFCYIILIFVKKIFIESNVEWYSNISKNDIKLLDISKIKHIFIKFLKTYMFYLLISTFTLTNVKTLFDEYLTDRFDLSEFFPDLNGGLSKYKEDIIDQKSKSIYNLKILTLKQIELNKKIKEINNKLKNNLLKLDEINNYYEDEKHEYLLNSEMEPVTIRKSKDENNIEDVFNILKDILQLK